MAVDKQTLLANVVEALNNRALGLSSERWSSESQAYQNMSTADLRALRKELQDEIAAEAGQTGFALYHAGEL